MSKEIKLFRIANDIEQIKLAGMLEISPAYLNMIEKGKRRITTEIAQKFYKISAIRINAEPKKITKAEKKKTLERAMTHIIRKLEYLYRDYPDDKETKKYIILLKDIYLTK